MTEMTLEPIDVEAQERVPEPNTREDLRQEGQELMRPCKEGQTGFKAHEPANVDLAETRSITSGNGRSNSTSFQDE